MWIELQIAMFISLTNHHLEIHSISKAILSTPHFAYRLLHISHGFDFHIDPI